MSIEIEKALGIEVIESRKNRITGGIVDLVLDPVDDRGRWKTRCGIHGVAVPHPSRKIAREWMADPTTWCQPCQIEHQEEAR